MKLLAVISILTMPRVGVPGQKLTLKEERGLLSGNKGVD
jgi:hypothetical protein